MHASRLFGMSWLTAGLWMFTGTVCADEALPETTEVTVKVEMTPAVSPFGTQQPVSDETLRESSGKDDVSQTVVASNTANVSGNSVNGTSVTGTITFDGAAFQNLNGLSVLSANTGNNVAINASMNVNVAIRP